MKAESELSNSDATSLTWQRFRSVLVGLGIAIGLAAALSMVVGLALLGQLLAFAFRSPGC